MMSRSNSSGVRVRDRRAMTLGSSVWSHGFETIALSRTARLKIECSIVWYLRMERGDKPPVAAWFTQSWIADGEILAIGRGPNVGRKCLFRLETYAALVVASMCLLGSQSFST